VLVRGIVEALRLRNASGKLPANLILPHHSFLIMPRCCFEK
jgi:hypothetical protein